MLNALEVDIEIIGGNEVYITNYKKLKVYEDKQIVVCGFNREIVINGDRLMINNFSKYGMCVKGSVFEVIICRKSH